MDATHPYVVHFRTFKLRVSAFIPAKPMGFKGYRRKKPVGMLPLVLYFSPIPIKNVSDDLSREDLGLSVLTVLKWLRNSLTRSS